MCEGIGGMDSIACDANRAWLSDQATRVMNVSPPVLSRVAPTGSKHCGFQDRVRQQRFAHAGDACEPPPASSSPPNRSGRILSTLIASTRINNETATPPRPRSSSGALAR